MTRGRRPTSAPASIGARDLIAAISARGITHRLAASDLGIRPSRLSRLLSGEYPITLAEALRVQDAYGIQPAAWARALRAPSRHPQPRSSRP